MPGHTDGARNQVPKGFRAPGGRNRWAFDREHLEPRRGQLDGQGEAVQAVADLRHREGILGRESLPRLVCLRTIEEEAHGGIAWEE